MAVGRAICFMSVLVVVEGSDFLGAKHHASDAPISKDEVESTFLEELNSMNDKTLQEWELDLRSLFDTMPKNEWGKLEPSAVRYVLHRFFAQKHGWHMVGLDRAGGLWNASGPTTMLKNQVPTYVEDIFEQKLAMSGLELKELAVLAATLTDLVKKESFNELVYIVDALNLSNKTTLNTEQLKRVFRSFLVAKIWGIEEEGDPASNLRTAERELSENYLGWGETRMWESDEIETYKFLNKHRHNPFVTGISFDMAVAMASDMNDRQSQFHFLQCRSLKNQLLEMEQGGSGRVPLGKFYSGGNSDHWPFVERKEYLKEIGVLDETDPKRPSVIIQNYLLGPSNCLETSGFYSLCCRDECEDILVQVEKALGVPSALPRQIVDVVQTVGSESVHAPRNLSVALVSRLEEISAHHGGVVPLHGRLFSQWLHHAYPQECAFPHVAGTVTRQTPDDWAESRGFEDANARHEDMKQHTVSLNDSFDKMDPLPWTAVEELVSVQRHGQKADTKPWWSRLRMAALVGALATLAYSMTHAAHSGVSHQRKMKSESHLV